MITSYGKMEYWDNRYLREPENFDWYQRYENIKDIIEPYLKPDSKILHVGAGNSRLSEDMFDDGFQMITSIDISGVLIKIMNEKFIDKGPNFKYIQMDARQLDFEDSSFDFIIEKATLDTLLCGENSTGNGDRMLSEIYRVLKPKGAFVSVSHGIPEERDLFLKKGKFDWDVIAKKIPRPTLNGTPIPLTPEEKELNNFHYLYICKRRSNEPEPAEEKVEEEKVQKKEEQKSSKKGGKKSPSPPSKAKKK